MGQIFTTSYAQVPVEPDKIIELREVVSDTIDTSSHSKNRESTLNAKFYESLVQYVKTNNSGELTNCLQILDPSTRHHWVNYVDPKYKKPLLILACEGKFAFRNVDATTVETLIINGAKIDYFDENWYGWEAIHYAAQCANPGKLQVLVNYLGKNKINTLTSLSENALHVLLGHGKFVEAFNITCLDGFNSKLSRIVRSQQQETLNCVQILIDAGVDINHNNFWNETPILVAIKQKYFEVVKLLLKGKNVDLDSCQDPISKKTARQLLKNRDISLDLLPKHVTTTDPSKILFQYLKAGDEESFLKYNNGKISKENINSFDGDNENNSSCTLLQYCFRRGLINCEQNIQNYEEEGPFGSTDIISHELVQNFCQNGMVRCIEHLLNNGADSNVTLRKFQQPLIQVASLKKYFPFVCMILGHRNANVPSVDICITILKLIEGNHNDIDNTLSILLNKLRVDMLEVPERNVLKDALMIGVKKLNNMENVRLLLKLSGSISVKKSDTLLEEIEPEVIQAHLDDCIEKSNEDIYINYDSLVEDSDETMALRIFFHSSALNQFLNHLIIKCLIRRKWHKLRIIFYLNLILCIILYLLTNIFVLLKFTKTTGLFVDFVFYLGSIFIICFAIKESFQIIRNYIAYVTELTNWLELLFLIFAVITFYSDKDWVEIIMVYLVMTSNLVLLLVLEQVPALTKYMIILRTVIFYLKYIIFYFIQFVAFAICFYLLFSKPDQSFMTELPNKLFETIILFTGNLDYMETNNFEKYELSARIIFIFFVLSMAIILHNLLLGLLVTDMSDIKKDVKLYEQIRRARFIIRVDDFLKRRFFSESSMKEMFNNSRVFQEVNKKHLILDDEEEDCLDENEKLHLENVLAKKAKTQNQLRKLYSYIKNNNKRVNEKVPHEVTKEILDRIKLLEERVKDLHDIKEIIKSEFTKYKTS